MSSLNPDVIQLRVLIDGSPARKELAELGQQAQEVKQAMVGLKKNSDEYAAGSAKLQAITTRQAELRKEIGTTGLSMRELNAEMGRARAIFSAAVPNTEQWAQAAARINELKEARAELTNQNRIDMRIWEATREQYQVVSMTTEQLALETQRLKTQLARPDLGAADKARLAAQLSLVKDRTEQLTNANRIAADAWAEERKGLKMTEMNMQQLGKEAQHLRSKLEVMGPNDTGLQAVRNQLTAVQNRAKQLESGLGPLGRAWQSMKTQVMSAGAVIGAMFAGGAIINGMRNLIRSAAEYSDAIADVRKTTGLSLPVVKELSNELSKMDTRTSRAEMLALARDAGKLGISAKEDVMAFVRAGNQIRIALGEDLGDDAIKNIGKLVDLFKLKGHFGLEGAMLKVGSAINELGMASTAGEGYMVEFIKRMGGIAPLAGITADQTLALGATLDSLGQTSEVSSTALSKLLVKLGGDVPRYAKLAGVSVEQFSTTLRKNALEALIMVLNGTKKTEGGVQALAETLGDMGIDAARAAGVFGVLSENTDRLHQMMEISNKAMNDGTSVTEEYDVKNTNLAATLAKLSREFNRLITSNRVVSFMESLVNALRNVVDWAKRNGDAIAFVAKVLATATVAWVNYRIVGELWARGAAIKLAITRALSIAQGLFTGSTISAARATIMFNNALKANPLGFVAGLLTPVIGLFVSFGQEVNTATENQKEHNAQLTETARLLATIRDSGNKTAAMGKLTPEQLEAHRQELQNQLAQLSDVQAAVVVAEETKSATIIGAQKRRNEEIKKLEAQLATESDIQRRFDLNLRLEDLKSAYRAEYDVRRATGKEITNAESLRMQEDLKRQIAAVDAEIAARRQGGHQIVRTVEQIEKEIQELEGKRKTTSSTSTQWQEYTAQITKLEQERARITGESHKAGQAKAKENLDELLRQMEEWREKMRQTTLSDDEKELAQLDAKHAEELRKYKEQQAKLIAAKKLTPEQAETDVKQQEDINLDERTLLMGQQADKKLAALKEANERIQQALGEQHNAELQADVQFYADQIAKGREAGRNVVELERQHKDALLKLYEQNALDLTAQEAKKWDELILQAKKKLEEYDETSEKAGIDTKDPAVQAERDAQLKDIADLENAKAKVMKAINDKRRRDEENAEHEFSLALRTEIADRLQSFGQIASATGNLVSSITQYMDAGVQAAETRADQDGVRTDEEIDRINRLKEERRKAALLAIAVQGAAAIANGIASAMTMEPWPVAMAAAISTVATVIGLIAQAKAMMNDTSSLQAPSMQQQPALQDVPLGAEGMGASGDGKVFTAADGGTVLEGPSHADDGLRVFNPKTGKPVAEVEGGELMLILSRAATNANADLIPAMLRASKAGRRMEFLQPVQPPNSRKMQQAMRIAHFADGGAYGSFPAQQPPAAPDQSALLHQLMAAMERMVKGQERAATAVERIKDIKAVVALNPEYDRKQEEWATLKSHFTSKAKTG